MAKYYAFRDNYSWLNRFPAEIVKEYLNKIEDIKPYTTRLYQSDFKTEMTSRGQKFASQSSNLMSIFLEIDGNFITGFSSPNYNGHWVDVNIQLKESFEDTDTYTDVNEININDESSDDEIINDDTDDEASDFDTDEEFSDDEIINDDTDDDYDVITYDAPKRAVAQTYQGSKNWEQIKEGSSNNNNNEQPKGNNFSLAAQGLRNLGVFTSNNVENGNPQAYPIEQFEVDDSSVTNQEEPQKRCTIM